MPRHVDLRQGTAVSECSGGPFSSGHKVPFYVAATTRLETVRLLLRQRAAGPRPATHPVPTVRADLARIAVPAPTLAAYDVLTGGRA